MVKYSVIQNTDEAVQFLQSIPSDDLIFIDTETVGLYGYVRLLQIYAPAVSDEVKIIDFYFVDKSPIYDELKRKYVAGYNLAYDFSVLGFATEKFEDLFFAAKVKFPMAEKYSLDAILEYIGITISSDKKAMQKADWSLVITDDMLRYAAEDVLYLEVLHEAMKSVYSEFVYILDKLTLKYIIEFQKNGLKVDRVKHKKLFTETLLKLSELENKLPINYNSPQQVKQYLGTSKADKEVLKELMYEGNKDAEMVFYAKKYYKNLNFLRKYDKDRVYGHFNPAGAVSGRFSCSEENLQQIPRDLIGVFGFTEEENKTFVHIDYPQIELRLAVCMWGDEMMEKLFREGKDLHIATASVIYQKDENDITKEERQVAKSANFGLLYGMGIEKFRRYVRTNTGILLSFEEAKEVREKWFSLYYGFWRKHQEVFKEYRKNGYYLGHTTCGRPYKGKTLNDSLNIMIQGSGAELIKLAIHYYLQKSGVNNIVNVVHDAIILETSKDEATKYGEMLKEAMYEAWVELSKTFAIVNDLPCPLDVDYIANLGEKG